MDSPERIYHWLDSQLSIARYYGDCKFNGHDYVIAYDEDGSPLVRKDVLKRERSAQAPSKERSAGKSRLVGS